MYNLNRSEFKTRQNGDASGLVIVILTKEKCININKKEEITQCDKLSVMP